MRDGYATGQDATVLGVGCKDERREFSCAKPANLSEHRLIIG